MLVRTTLLIPIHAVIITEKVIGQKPRPKNITQIIMIMVLGTREIKLIILINKISSLAKKPQIEPIATPITIWTSAMIKSKHKVVLIPNHISNQ
jgi:hypothetical protein